MQRQVQLIGAAWGLGGAHSGCADAPEALAPLVTERLRRHGRAAAPGPVLRPARSRLRRQLAVSRLCAMLASAVADALRRGQLPCVLGGDHSCAGGTWSGAARSLQEKGEGTLGLVWVDAHMDSHTPRTSPSGRLHGMPLAWLLGLDDDPLYGLATAALEPSCVCLVGVRSFEPPEEERLRSLGVRVILADEIARRGLESTFDEALEIAARRSAAFGISIDLDAVSPEDCPAVATPEPGGLPAGALARALARIGGDERLAAVELVEYCPRLDRDGRSAAIAAELAVAALCGASEEP